MARVRVAKPSPRKLQLRINQICHPTSNSSLSPRPAFDIRAELDDREDFDSEDEDEMKKLAKQRDADVEKYHYKPIADFQDYKWVISTIGKDLLGKYVTQSMKTDPDDFGMYIYNDFASYGQQEIVENMASFSNDPRKAETDFKPDPGIRKGIPSCSTSAPSLGIDRGDAVQFQHCRYNAMV